MFRNKVITLHKINIMNILLIDNYDSFTYNLSQYLEEEGGEDVEVTVWRNDQFGLDDVERFDKIVCLLVPVFPMRPGFSKLSFDDMHRRSQSLVFAWANRR